MFGINNKAIAEDPESARDDLELSKDSSVKNDIQCTTAKEP